MMRGLAIVAVVVLAMPLGLQAGPLYSLNHNSDAFGNAGLPGTSANIGPQGTPISYSFSGLTYFTGANFGVVQASVNQGSIGIFASAFNNGQYAPQRQEVVGGFGFDVLFSSPTNDPISVIMNLDLAGEMSGGGSAVSVFVSTVNIAGFQLHGGGYVESSAPFNITRNGMLSSFTADGTKQTVSTGQFIQVAVNVPTRFDIALKTGQAYHPLNSTVSFQDTLNLTTSGDVFSILSPLADQISVNSADAGIVNNRFGQDTSPVPEPSSLALLGMGVLSLFGFRRRFQNKKLSRDNHDHQAIA